MKKKIVIGIVVAVLTLAIAVPAAAAAGTTAKGTGSLLDYCKSLVQQLVTDKKLAQSDADAVLAALDSKEQALQADRQAMGGRGGAGIGLGLDETATVLGMSATDLQAKLTAGSTVWKIASDAGKLDALKDAMIKAYSTRLDEMVTAGRLTKDEASQKLADVTAAIKAITADAKVSLRSLGLPGMGGKDGMRGDMNGDMNGGMRGGMRGSKPGTDSSAGSATTPSTAPKATTGATSNS